MSDSIPLTSTLRAQSEGGKVSLTLLDEAVPENVLSKGEVDVLLMYRSAACEISSGSAISAMFAHMCRGTRVLDCHKAMSKSTASMRRSWQYKRQRSAPRACHMPKAEDTPRNGA
jgi:hypothetical protein